MTSDFIHGWHEPNHEPNGIHQRLKLNVKKYSELKITIAEYNIKELKKYNSLNQNALGNKLEYQIS